MQKFISDTFTTTGIKLTPSQIRAFEVYEQELLEWNARFNLTAIRDVEGIRTKHFLDSLTCFPELASTSVSHLIDVGTGAGFPGIPLSHHAIDAFGISGVSRQKSHFLPAYNYRTRIGKCGNYIFQG